MSNAIGVEDHLRNLEKTLEPQAFQAEVRRLATKAVQTSPKHADYWKGLTKDYEWLDWDALVGDALSGREPTTKAKDPEVVQGVLEAMKAQMPSLKTQAQFNAFMATFEAVRLTLDAIFSSNAAKEAEGRKALEQALDLATKVTEVSTLLEEMPEAANSQAAQEFKNPPAQFNEYDVQRGLLTELENFKTSAELAEWYEATKDKRDQVVSQGLRNGLLDEIRRKQVAFKKAEDETK